MAVKQKNLSVRIGKLALSSPLIAASGTFGYGQELEGLIDFKDFGAIITKTITLKARKGNPPPRLIETPWGLLNSIGLENPGIDVFLRDKWPYLARLKTPVIISIGGETKDEFVRLTKRLDRLEDLKAIEVNISCPNIKKAKIKKRKTQGLTMFSQGIDETFAVVKVVRKLTSKTLIVKLTPNVTDISSIAIAASSAGADALCLVNTYFGMAVDIQNRRPQLANITGGLSGPAIKPLSLYAVYKTYKAVRKPIIGGGGIMNSADAIEFLTCGATALSLGTVNFINTKAPKEILTGIKGYLKKNKIKDIYKLRGSLRT
ncbi:MAG: dihydroorotate dehydrogenase [Candidatus Omnitrophica bacterium]|nr:dihydroorotate dehydrogenase [Candidatus Omnitrophota bacterium]